MAGVGIEFERGTTAIPDGTVAAPSIAFIGSRTTGFYQPADDQIGITVAGARVALFAAAAITLDVAVTLGGGLTLGGNLNMANNLILNIGAAGTDFTAGGGLTLAALLTVSAGGINVTGGIGNAAAPVAAALTGFTTITGGAAATSLSIDTQVTGAAPADRNILFRTGNAANPQVLATRLTLGGNAATAVATWASVTHTGLVLSGALDAGNQIISNIGVAGTDFTATGGLTLADILTVSAGGINVTGGVGNAVAPVANALTAFSTITGAAAATSLSIDGQVTGGAPLQRDLVFRTGNAANPQVLATRLTIGSNAATATATWAATNHDFGSGTVLIGGVTGLSNAIGAPAAAVDVARLGAADFAVGDARLYIQSELGSAIIIGNNAFTAAATTFALMNDTVTTLNFASAATTMRLGAAAINIGIGGAAGTNVGVYFQNTFTAPAGTSVYGIFHAMSLTAAPNQEGWMMRVAGGVTEAASGTHGFLGGILLTFSFTGAAASTTDVRGLHLDGFTSPAAARATNLYINSVSGATDNFSMWVDAGISRFDGVVALLNESGAPTAVADYARLGSVDIAAGDARLAIQSEAGSVIYLGNNTLRADGGLTLTNLATAAGTTAVTITQAAHTAVTVERPALTVGAATITLADTTTIAEYAWQRLAAPTFVGVAAGGAEVITDAATLLITGAPVQGANITLTRTQSLWVQGGISRFAGEVWIDTPAAIGAALADTAKLKVVDFAAGDARFNVQAELGSPILLGNDTVRATWATQAAADATVDLGAVVGTTYSLVRITSSERYKRITSPALPLDSRVIYGIELVGWESLLAADRGRLGYSPTAERVYAAHPSLAQLGGDGGPIGVNWYHLNTLVLAEVQNHDREIERLRHRVSELEGELELLHSA